MILNLLVLLLIVLLTLYLSAQGLLSATLALITATFASIFAMALFEPLQSLVGDYRPDYARGVTFLLLFFLCFSAIRISADFAVPKNIVLPPRIDRSCGGLVGFFAALVVIGTSVIGIEMLPLPTAILMYDRFPAKAESDTSATHDRMQVLRDENGKLADVPGIVAPQKAIRSPLFIAPDRFVLAIWDLASNRSLGGSIAFESRHPDLSVESYGYRNVVEYGAGRTLVPSLVHLTGAYRDKDSADLKRFNLADSGLQALVLRTEIDQGTDQPKVSADADSFFRITPTQIRLVTDKGRQYYPVGFLEEGVTFHHTSLASGHLVDDYPVPPKVVIDWVFPIAEDEKPQVLEVKQLARIEASDAPILANADKAAHFKPLAVGYPPMKRNKNPSVFTLTVEMVNPDKSRAPIAKADVFVLKNTVQKREIGAAIQRANDQLLDALNSWDDNKKGWGDQLNGKPGVPDKYTLKSRAGTARDEGMLKAADDHLQWSVLLPVLLTGELNPDGPRNLEAVNHYFDETLVPLLIRSSSSPLIKRGVTGPDGKFEVTLPKGVYAYVVRAKTGEFLGVWCKEMAAEPKANIDAKCDTNSTDFKIDLRINK
jgi:hypothetical protein